MAASRYAIGDARFVEQTEGRVEARRSGRAQDEDLDFPRWTVPPDEIDAAVAKHYGIDVQQLRAHGRSAGEAKVVAMELACRLAGLTGRASAPITARLAPQRSARRTARCGKGSTRSLLLSTPCSFS